MAEGTAALRAAAARWSLAGDQQLLNILQDIHQRIVTQCNETNRRLEEMSRGLRDASVNLQNVNNKFLALSNTQFVESRVYDDDADVTAAPGVDEAPPQLKDLTSDLSKLKQSLQVLESYHEPLHILRDSDSDSDSDEDDDRLVLKPKDLYADRPLPYIIGTAPWQAKWHAGLVDEPSDSDSSASRPGAGGEGGEDQYSESEEEPAGHDPPERKISTGSSSLRSEAVSVSVSPARPSPSDVAAELARRLGGGVKVPEREPVYSEPERVVRKLYKPQQPAAAPLFPDEPPPLDERGRPSDDDIFAELQPPRPDPPRDTGGNDLFDFAPETNVLEQALFGERATEPTPIVSRKPPLFENESEPEINNTSIPKSNEKEDVKKPVGGISLFGTNKHAKSIGAAILKRNRRQSSTSGDESNTEKVKEVKTTEPKEMKKERDIFDDLFAKSEKLNKKNTNTAPVEPKEVNKDVFTDIFDDIDDIFSSDIVNVKIKETKKNEKPLFSDEDDLFAEISKTKSEQKQKVGINEKSALFDDDRPKIEKSVVDSTNKIVKNIRKESRGLFDSDSDDGLFTNAKTKDIPKENVQKTQEPVKYKISDDIFGGEDDGDDLFSKNKPIVKEVKNISKATVKSSALFDSDDELFVNNVKQNVTQEKEKQNVTAPNKDDNVFASSGKKNAIESSNNVVENSEDLFKTKEKSEALKVVENINNDIFDDGDELFKRTESSKYNDKTIDDSFDDEELFTSNKSSINSHQKTDETKEISKSLVKDSNDDIFDDNDELFKRTESSKQSTVKSSQNNLDDEELFSNNKSIMNKDTRTSLSKYTQNSKNDFADGTNNIIHDSPYEQTVNILRTTRIVSDEENIQTGKKQDIFNDDNDEELFKAAPTPESKESNYSENVMTPPTAQVNSESLKPNVDIFSDVFDDVPPIFEKPKESKKSQNVNALFDDDSDDETLFFKKNDGISDEKPDFGPSEERFGIFNDEPPEIDVDFTQKTIKNDDVPQKTSKSADLVENIGVSENSSIPNKIENITSKIDEINEVTTTKNSEDTTDNTVKEPKKVGKLKPMNLNINVNTLLPGASPKKKQVEDVDPHSASNEELHKTDKIEPAMVKSISFDDPEILDNKISKERAKIQVKRRPSTRRARKEAVRKSAIDLTDSSFDSSNDSNSNSVKDNVKQKVVKTVYILNDSDIFGVQIEKHEPVLETTKKHLNIVDSDEELFKSTYSKSIETKKDNLEGSNEGKSFLDSDDDDLFRNNNSQLKEEKNEKERKTFLDSDDNEDLFKQTKSIASSNNIETNVIRSTVISEDGLFNKRENKNTEIEKVRESKSFLDSDDNDLFTSKTTKTTTGSRSNHSSDEDLFRNKKGIETLGKVYESKDTKSNVANIEKPHNIFDDFPPIPKGTKVQDEKIKPKGVIKEKAPSIDKPVVKRSILDDSSDEDDLFKTKTKLTVKKEGKSLFGDDPGDGEDLFGPTTVKEQQKPGVPAPQSSKELKPAETVFVDPLSLFDEDE